MAILPPTGFPATAFPSLPSFSRDKIRQFSVHTLSIGLPGQLGFGGISTVNPITVSHM